MKTKMLFSIVLFLGICNSHAQAGSLSNEYEAKSAEDEQREQTHENLNRRIQAEGHIVYCRDMESLVDATIFTFVKGYVFSAYPPTRSKPPSADELINYSSTYKTKRDDSQITWRAIHVQTFVGSRTYTTHIDIEYNLRTNNFYEKFKNAVDKVILRKYQCEVLQNKINDL